VAVYLWPNLIVIHNSNLHWDYRILCKLGEAGGVVYEADNRPASPRALKVIRGGRSWIILVKLFQREAMALARLKLLGSAPFTNRTAPRCGIISLWISARRSLARLV